MTSPIRFLRQVVAPNGRHRLRPVLLPDEPIPPRTEPVPCQVLDEGKIGVNYAGFNEYYTNSIWINLVVDFAVPCLSSNVPFPVHDFNGVFHFHA